MIEITLTKGKVAIIDKIDSDLAGLKWCTCCDQSSINYAVRAARISGRKTVVKMHRIILERALGRSLIIGECVDHIDGNSLNNKRSNLRLATASQNNANSIKCSMRNGRKVTSEYKGVSWCEHCNKWRANISMSYKNVHLGLFDDERTAADAYNSAAQKYYGAFAKPNLL